MKNILVLCTGNSCRSQIAHGYLDKILINKAKIYSAGIETHGINKYAVKVMSMDNIDIENNTSNLVDEYVQIDFDFIITVCDHANETCPNFYSQNAIRLHRNFFDPSHSKSENNWKELFEKCRDEIKLFCLEFSREFFS